MASSLATDVKNVQACNLKGADIRAQEVTCKEKICTTDACLPDNSSNNVYLTRFVYSSKVNPRQVDALMAKKSKNVKNWKHVSQSVQGRVIWGKTQKSRLCVIMSRRVRSR